VGLWKASSVKLLIYGLKVMGSFGYNPTLKLFDTLVVSGFQVIVIILPILFYWTLDKKRGVSGYLSLTYSPINQEQKSYQN
jgi:hypothetical protein